MAVMLSHSFGRSCVLLVIALSCGALAVEGRSLATNTFATNTSVGVGAAEVLTKPVLFWNKCKEVQKLGEVCIGVYGDPTATPSSLGVQLTLMEKVFLLPVLNAKACIDDAVLLQLLLSNPRFKDFATQIQAIIVAEQLLAAEVLSECVLLTDTEFSKDDAGAATFSACPQLVSRWGCFRTRCLYSHIQEFECFNIHAPTKKEEMGVKQAIVIV